MRPKFDLVGLGLNATDTVVVLPKFPAYAGKVAFLEEFLSPGGQVASAVVTGQKLGLKTKYLGSLGDDERGRVQLASLEESGVNIDDIQVREGCPNQTAYILIDQSTGERTVLWYRDESLRITPAQIAEEQITCARMLHVDGCDTEAAAKAAQIARKAGIPVSADVDTVYPGFEHVLPHVDYLMASSEFPGQWTKERDPFQALRVIQRQYGMKVAGMTLGAHGALALCNGKFHYSPAFVVNCVDTTGAGDAFHGAFCYAILKGYPLGKALDFSNACAALNCQAMGARGGLGTKPEASKLARSGKRRSNKTFENRAKGE